MRNRGESTAGERLEPFEALVKGYFQKVYSFFIRQGCRPEEASDLTQDTLLRVFQNMDKYRGGSEQAYLMTITKNIWKNELRRRGAVKRGDPPRSLDHPETASAEGAHEPLFGPPPRSPEDEALWNERVEALRREIRKLPPRNRRALQMRIEGLSYREIAVAMRTSVDAVKKLIFQARQRLKETLGPAVVESLDEEPGEDDE